MGTVPRPRAARDPWSEQMSKNPLVSPSLSDTRRPTPAQANGSTQMTVWEAAAARLHGATDSLRKFREGVTPAPYADGTCRAALTCPAKRPCIAPHPGRMHHRGPSEGGSWRCVAGTRFPAHTTGRMTTGLHAAASTASTTRAQVRREEDMMRGETTSATTTPTTTKAPQSWMQWTTSFSSDRARTMLCPTRATWRSRSTQ